MPGPGSENPWARELKARKASATSSAIKPAASAAAAAAATDLGGGGGVRRRRRSSLTSSGESGSKGKMSPSGEGERSQVEEERGDGRSPNKSNTRNRDIKSTNNVVDPSSTSSPPVETGAVAKKGGASASADTGVEGDKKRKKVVKKKTPSKTGEGEKGGENGEDGGKKKKVVTKKTKKKEVEGGEGGKGGDEGKKIVKEERAKVAGANGGGEEKKKTRASTKSNNKGLLHSPEGDRKEAARVEDDKRGKGGEAATKEGETEETEEDGKRLYEEIRSQLKPTAKNPFKKAKGDRVPQDKATKKAAGVVEGDHGEEDESEVDRLLRQDSEIKEEKRRRKERQQEEAREEKEKAGKRGGKLSRCNSGNSFVSDNSALSLDYACRSEKRGMSR